MFPSKKDVTQTVDDALTVADEKFGEHVATLEDALDRNAVLVATALAGVALALLVVAVVRL